MGKNKRIRITIAAAVLLVVILSVVGAVTLVSIYFTMTVGAIEGGTGKYLFCYFVGNEPNEERVHFALSADGYNFTPLNNNQAIIIQTLGKYAMRDPFLFRSKEGNKFYIIGTDMTSEGGTNWANNNSMVVWESDDLVHWANERIIDFSTFLGHESAIRVWAPQVIYDEVYGAYMIYWSHDLEDDDIPIQIWYAYTDDFVTLKTMPKILFTPPSGKAGIDADIIEKDGTYYLYYKDEDVGDICYATADKLTGQYIVPKGNNVVTSLLKKGPGVEGSAIYRLEGTDGYLMIMDRYKKHYYHMQYTTDLINFKTVRKQAYSMDFSPRHGSIILITDEEYERLLNTIWD